MKYTKQRHVAKSAVLLSLFIGLSGHLATAAPLSKADNALDLGLAGSWVGGAVPGAGDVAVWDSTVTGPNSVSLGADLSWQGIQITNPSGMVTINGGNSLTLGSAGIDMSAATQGLTINSAVSLNAAQSWNVSAGRDLIAQTGVSTGGNTLSLSGLGTKYLGNVSGGGALQVSDGLVVLEPGNTYSGGTVINGGTVRIDNDSALGAVPGAPTTNITVNGGGTLINTGFNTILKANRQISLNSGELEVYTTAATYIFGDISGAGGLRKNGNISTARLVLTGNNTYTGDTRVSHGVLFNHGTNTSSAVIVESGGTFGGVGSSGDVTVQSGGTLSPYEGAGQGMTVTSLSLASGATSIFEVNGLAIQQYDDILATSGNIVLGGTLNLVFGNLLGDGNITLFIGANITGSFDAINASGSYAGAFTPFSGSIMQLVAGEQILYFDNATGALSVATVPEPSAYLLLGVGLVVVLVSVRRRAGARI